MPVLLERLTGQELSELPRGQTLFFFPMGPLEDHGPGLPLATDAVVAEKLAWHLALGIERDLQGWKVVIAPRLPFGVDATSKKISSLRVRGYVVRDAVLDLSMALYKQGFCFFGVVSGHFGPRQLTALEEAGKLFRKKTRFRGFKKKTRALFSVSSALVPEKEARKHPFSPRYAEHGGRQERAKLLSIDPEWIQPSPNTPASLGDVSEGEGKNLYADEVSLLLPKVRAVLEGSDANAVFRSWYSVYPPNSSFFLGWVLVFGLLILMIGWVAIMFSAFA